MTAQKVAVVTTLVRDNMSKSLLNMCTLDDVQNLIKLYFLFSRMYLLHLLLCLVSVLHLAIAQVGTRNTAQKSRLKLSPHIPPKYVGSPRECGRLLILRLINLYQSVKKYKKVLRNRRINCIYFEVASKMYTAYIFIKWYRILK